jgi:ketosteroid isomerase-like protein
MSEENVQLARDGFEAWLQRDFDRLDEMCVSDFEFVPAIAAGVDGGSLRGRDEIEHFFEGLDEIWETFRIDTNEFRAVGERVLGLGHVTAKGRVSGLELDQPIFTVLSIRDGKLVRMQSFLDEQAALEAAEHGAVA